MVDLKIYQSFYHESQRQKLDTAFIPYDNTVNETPNLREFPQWLDLFSRHKDTDVVWGLVSWLWSEKTGIQGKDFKDFILNHPGYDMYHVEPFGFTENQYANIWTQGDQWVKGMIDFCNVLFPILGIKEDVRNIIYNQEEWMSCNYYVGNSRFWRGWLQFLTSVLSVCKKDVYLDNYLTVEGHEYNGKFVPNFPFVTERLVSLYIYLQRGDPEKMKVMKWS